MQAHFLEGGFLDQPIDASRAFRAIMTAMARPGEINAVAGAQPPAPLSLAAGTVLLTLCDPETPLFLAPSHDTPQVRDWITFHTGAPFAVAENAIFAIGAWDQLPLAAFPCGTAEYPDRSTTLIVEIPVLSSSGATLRGPGIKDQTQLSLPEIRAFQDNARLFPLGLDFIFTSGDRLAALPRTTRVS
ncbi:phosphonate metabolism protein PhnH [Octadecabacter antarcticus 307]|uniref:Phosphonate metabolism protein PhnH n=1 Tax=Octadecabacter antarcticus 307 TaxID=391626 RepID=M9R7R0_9RHOB|nr:phosphonate C-P lyase system protein PhnH [Octadecabacter antarcticus]AGI68262.1 phosphonate metabolism protein PhnH [Octadecabacter antarcticus 307]